MNRAARKLTRWLLVAVLALAEPRFARAAEPIKLDSLKAGSRTYREITVLGTSETDLYFKHSRGIANVKLKYLEPAMQKLFDYDPKVAEEAERKQAAEDSAYHETVALELTERAKRTIKEARDAAASAEDNPADPVSPQSLIGQKAPKLTVEKWLGDKPTTDEKAVLVFFWTTWSVPCRKAIPDMNSYQKKFREKLVVVGLSSQALADMTDFAEIKIEFPLAIDTKSKFASAAGVTSVPSVLLIDAKGNVRYQGHPAALDTSKVRKLLGSGGEAKE